MVHGLFRSEVIKARSASWMGPIQLSSPISRWIYLSLALGLAAAVLGFLVFGHYTRRSHVTGQLVPTAGLLGVSSSMTGTVTRVYVHEG